MTRSLLLAPALLLLMACAPKGDSDAGGAADSAGAGGYADSMAMPSIDSLAAAAESLPGTPMAANDSAGKAASMTKTGAPAKVPGTMGRDSAFGPSFMVDSNGKLVPIPKKKP